MKINNLGKIALLPFMVMLSLSAISAVQAASTTNLKGFKYIEPQGLNVDVDTCPGPYEPLAISMKNNTTYSFEWGGNHSQLIGMNIYFVLNDNRTYQGQYVSLTRGGSPLEIRGEPAPSGRWSNPGYSNQAHIRDFSNSGPIIGAQSIKDIRNEPIRNYTNNNPAYDNQDYVDLWNKYGSQLGVLTNAAGDDGYMDWQGHETTKMLPIRNYKLLHIEVMVAGQEPDMYIGDKAMVWEGRAVSDSDGTRLVTTKSHVMILDGSGKKSTATILGNMPKVGEILDLRAIDKLEFNPSGGPGRKYQSSMANWITLTNKADGRPVKCQ